MAVFVLDKHQKPLMPCSEKRARLLLNRKKAHVHFMAPFTIRLVHRTTEGSILQPMRCKIDPGSTTSGIAILRENKESQTILSMFELAHRGRAIRDALKACSQKRRRRRSNLRYREKRFLNHRKKEGWLSPSLRHRIDTILAWMERFRKRAPIVVMTCEKVRFDSQKLLNPEIQGVEYARGTLFGYEAREYLLEKWDRKCAYCNQENIPLQIDHIVAQSRGGSNRIDNLTLACSVCNQKKGNQTVETFCPEKAHIIRSKPSLQGSATVNATRLALFELLRKLPMPCEEGTGGQTKYNRSRLGIPKTHALDAACTGVVLHVENWNIPTGQIVATGRGTYQRTRVNRFGFPRGYLLPFKQVHGFQTGDLVISSVPSGKKQGCYKGRVAIRASGYFNIQTATGLVQGISSRYCRLIQRSDGYHYPKMLPSLKNIHNTFKTQTKERHFLPALTDRVSASSIG